jgi:hypothetical protein
MKNVFILLLEVFGRSDTEALLARFFSNVGIEIEIRLKTYVKNTVPIGPTRSPKKSTPVETQVVNAINDIKRSRAGTGLSEAREAGMSPHPTGGKSALARWRVL